MTVSEKIISMLVSNGMFESQAKEVMKLAITKLKNSIEDYTITFNSPSDQYPNIVYSILYMEVKPIALKWIDKNKPMAWYRMMFI